MFRVVVLKIVYRLFLGSSNGSVYVIRRASQKSRLLKWLSFVFKVFSGTLKSV